MMSSRGKRTKRGASTKGASGKAPSRAPNRVKSVFISEKEGKRSLVFRRGASRGEKAGQKTIFSLPDLVRDISATIFEPLLVLDHNLRVVSANRYFYKIFQIKRKETEGKPFYRIGNRLWDIPELKEKLGEIFQKQTSFEDLELKQKLPNIGERSILVNARIISGQGEEPGFALLVIRDVTESKKAEGTIERLSSFPTVNPMPIVETDIAGKVLYMNPAAKKLFPDLWNRGDKHPFLTELSSAVDELNSGKREWVRRQVEFEGAWYGQTIYKVGDGSRVRVYSADITEALRIRQALQTSERKFRSIYDESPIGIELYDGDGRLVEANRSCLEIFGVSDIAEVKGFNLFEDPNLSEEAKKRLLKGKMVSYEGPFDFEKVREYKLYRTQKSRMVYLDVVITPLSVAGEKFQRGYLVQVQDITERKHKEEELHQFNRVLKALSDSNQAMMHAKSESDYLKEVCNFIIRDCGYLMVWIGFAGNDENKTVRPVAQAGFEKGYLETVNITWADTERGRGPTGTAIRTGKPTICRNMLTDPNFKPWRKEALKRGYASSIVLPLTSDGKSFGAINIYSKEPDPFSEEEIKLLTELSNDLAYGIMTIRLRLEREQAEAALAKSEEKYRFLYEEGQSLNLVIGMDQTVKDVNKAALIILGYMKKEVIGKPALYFIPVGGRERVKEILVESFAGGTTKEYEVPVLAKDGSVRTILFAPGQVTLMEGDSISGIVVTGIDITERKRAEEALREAKEHLEIRVTERTAELEQINRMLQREISERKWAEKIVEAERQRFNDVLETLPAYLVLLTPDYHVPFANRFFRERFGESHGKRCYEYLFHRSEPCEDCETYKVLKTNAPHSWEWTGPDGHNYDIYDFPFTDADGSPLILEMGIDITGRKRAETELKKHREHLEELIRERTGELERRNVQLAAEIAERKQAEEALRKSEERLNRAEEIAHVGSWELDLLSNHLSWSDEVYRIFGLKPQEFGATYEAFLEAVHPDDRQTVDAAYSSSLREGKDAYEIEHRVVRRIDGEVRIVYEKCEHIRDENGRIIRSVGMVHDITERKQTEEKINKLNEALKSHAAELEASNKELEAFTYSVSHDLRAPVRKIEGFSRALLEDYAEAIDEQGQDYLKRLRGAADKMKQLIEDLLNLSHLTRAEMKREETDLGALAQTIAEDLQKSQPERKAEFKIDKKLVAKVDRRLFEIALENLLGNAWKFTSTQPEARIEFTATEENGEMVYLVRDNGVGFDMTYADRLFIPFQRLHSTDEFPGTGIGLATVKRIIDRHGGRIWVEGGVEKGATFFFTLGYKNTPDTDRVLINSLLPGRKVENSGAE
jgi:PAS domain S-box-containing protein